MLEVVNGYLDKKVLEKTNLFEKDNIIDMSLLLNIGNIKELEKIKTRYECNEEIRTKEKIEKFKEKIKEYNNIRIWYSKIDAEEICFFLYVIYLINKYKKDISVYFIDISIYKNAYSLCCLDKLEIKNIINYTKEINKENINNFVKIWEQIEKENSNLRIINKDNIKSVDYNYLDKKILEELSTYKEYDIFKFISKLVQASNEENKMCGIHGIIIFNYRINEMIKQNKIKVIREEKVKNILGEYESRKIICVKY